MSLNITKTGIFNGQIVEPFITLVDGSNWQLICYHYIDHGNNLFLKEEAGYCNKPGLYSRCQYADAFKYGNLWEFYAIQDGKEMRWTQTSAPHATAISGFTKISGAVTRGLARPNANNNTYFGYGSWWSAVGCWTVYGSGATRGIPGMDSTNAINYLAVYARINKPIAFAEDGIISGQEIYEY